MPPVAGRRRRRPHRLPQQRSATPRRSSSSATSWRRAGRGWPGPTRRCWPSSATGRRRTRSTASSACSTPSRAWPASWSSPRSSPSRTAPRTCSTWCAMGGWSSGARSSRQCSRPRPCCAACCSGSARRWTPAWSSSRIRASRRWWRASRRSPAAALPCRPGRPRPCRRPRRQHPLPPGRRPPSPPRRRTRCRSTWSVPRRHGRRERTAPAPSCARPSRSTWSASTRWWR